MEIQLNTLRSLLERNLRELHGQVGPLRGMSSEGEQAMLADLNDQATLESERTFSLKLKERNRALALKIKDALRKMDEGDYGICEDCGDEIAYRRLLAQPITSLCLSCKAEREAREQSPQATPSEDRRRVA